MEYKGKKALVMGLGLNGGGLQSALFLLKRGAEVTVTDLRDEKILSPSINELDTACKELGRQPIRYVLGKHEIEDFKKADIVIKNPGVRPDSPFLQVCKHTETDLSLFLAESKARLFAVTGTKGKSGTSCALHWILSKDRSAGRAFLGGNITVCPLTFLDELTDKDDVVLELSSFQLGDIKNHINAEGHPLLKPDAAILTSIMHDHLDRYASMEDYIDDKKNIYRGQDSNCVTIAGDDGWGKSFRAETKARTLIWSCERELSSVLKEGQSGGCIDSSGRGIARFNMEGVTEEIVELVPRQVRIPGSHQKINMLCAALAAYSLGVKEEIIRGALSSFSGVEHRLELFHESGGIRYYNDSAATIPEAAAACIEALTDPDFNSGGLILVTGGTDKNLDFSPLAKAAGKAKAIILLEGTSREKLIPMLHESGVSYSGPFDDLDKAVRCAASLAGDTDIVALSPGCASFGMFLNEFDRGRKWKEAVLRIAI
jgi:UDP-N-acetylmuramoylalanine--D-glutamate ligase